MIGLARDIGAILTKKEKRRVYVLLLAMTFTALVEIAGIASIMPFLALVSDPDRVGRAIPSWLRSLLGDRDSEATTLALGVLVLVALTGRNVATALTQWALLRYTAFVSGRLSGRLLATYLRRPYDYFLTRNTADLGANVLAEVVAFVTGMLIPALQACAQAIVAIFIVALLAAVDPLLSAIISTALGGSYFLLSLATSRKVARIGAERQKMTALAYRASVEALGAIREVKLQGKEQPFLDRYLHAARRTFATKATQQVLGQIPHFALETIAFGGILVIVLYLLTTSRDLQQALPLIGLYAFAAYRLMPALQTVFAGITSARFNRPSLQLLREDLKQWQPEELERPLPGRADGQRLSVSERIELKDLTFRYPNSEQAAIEKLQLEFKAGALTGLVGPTGSGKSTVLDLVVGLLRPSAGVLLVDDQPITDELLPRWQSAIGYVPQQIFLYDATLAANIAFGVPAEEIDHEAVRAASRAACLDEVALTELPAGYDTLLGESGTRLSGGQRQRVGIARALYRRPKVLVLDEATSALDGRTEARVLQAVRDSAFAKTVIMVSHRLATMRACDEILVLDRGRLVARSNYDHLLESDSLFQELSGSQPADPQGLPS